MKRFLVVLSFWIWVGVSHGDVHRYELVGNGGERGVYDAGIFLEALTRAELKGGLGFYVEPKFTEGDGETLEGLLKGRAGFGIVKGSSLWGAVEEGEDDEELLLLLRDEVRVVVVLWREVLHGLMRKEYVQSGTLSDLRILEGSQIVLGGVGESGFYGRRYVLPFLGWGEGEEMGIWGEVDSFEAMVWVSGVKSREVMEVMGGGDFVFLDMTKLQGLSVKEGSGGVWQRVRLEEGIYEGVKGSRDVLSQFVYLVALKGVSAKDVYGLTKTLFEERCRLERMSGLFYGILPLEEQIGEGEGVWSWHEGARDYYEERGGGREEECERS